MKGGGVKHADFDDFEKIVMEELESSLILKKDSNKQKKKLDLIKALFKS